MRRRSLSVDCFQQSQHGKSLDLFYVHKQSLNFKYVRPDLYVESQINRSVSRLFFVRMRLGEFDPPETNPYRKIPGTVISSPAHANLTREVEARGDTTVFDCLTF